MRVSLILLAFLCLLPCSVPAAETRLHLEATVADGGLRGFHLGLGEYFRVPESEIVLFRDRYRLREDDLPVALFIARRAQVEPRLVFELRSGGRNWNEITLHFGLGPEIYYLPVWGEPGPPYGKAYGHYRKKHRDEWHTIRLDDDEIVDLVNLRFLSEHYGHDPEIVIRLRSGGRDFVSIHDEIRHGRKKDDREDRREHGDDHGKGKDKGKGHEGKEGHGGKKK